MKIVMLGPFGLRPRGTMSVRALPLAEALAARGHAVTLLLPPWQNPEDAGRVWEERGVHLENLPLPRGIPGWFQLRLTQQLARRTRELRPDVVHAFKPKAYAGLAHLALRRHFPVVVDTDDWEGPGGWNELAPYSPPLKRFFAWQERWGLRHAAAVTVASRALETLVWAQGVPPTRVTYLPNGVVEMAPRASGSPGGRPTLLLYTRFFEFDLRRLWDVLRRVREARPAARVLVVGKGLFGEEVALLQLARDAGWQVAEGEAAPPDADLVYAGWVAPERLPELFAQAHVALYPFDDTLINRTKCPVKLLDLLAAGVPVVGEAVGQLQEFIQPGQTGILVPPGATEAFVQALLALLADPAQAQALGARAAEAVRARFSWTELAVRAEATYELARADSTTSR
ncbi:MAG TPA: glycosyltransferase family 4 protein [Anaerolineae bacterium]|nr:glycosyltransferase family 4 protein [Anaerolineae bacterium]